MKITKITKINSLKYSFVTDDGASFFLTRQEMTELDLLRTVKAVLGEEKSAEELDIEFSEEAFAKIEREIAIPRGKRYALGLLGDREYSVKSMSDKLKQTGYSEKEIDAIIGFLTDNSYLSDERYAMTVIRFGIRTKSRFKLEQKLKLKGISDELIRECFEKAEEELENTGESSEKFNASQIKRLLEKKLKTEEDFKDHDKVSKAIASLMRKGYRYAEIKEQIEILEK